MDGYVFLTISGFFVGLLLGLFLANKKRKAIISEAERKGEEIVTEAESRSSVLINSARLEAETLVTSSKQEAQSRLAASKREARELIDNANSAVLSCERRQEKLNAANLELRSRLQKSREFLEDITDRCSRIAADVEILNEDDLSTSKSYQEDRKAVQKRLKELAVNAIDGVKGSNSDVNIGNFVAISAKSDMAGALLLTTVDMLCSKVTANNGHQAMEKLTESIVAAEALVKCLDSRSVVNQEFRDLLVKRLEVEINYKKARQLAKEQQAELRAQEREEKKARQEAEKAQKAAEKEGQIKQDAITELERRMAEEGEAERAAHQEVLDKLKAELEEAHQRLERARSRAQDTKQGHVYVISNIGSFGEDVLKIGMTRRLEPMDRVKELGDASVPFTFDVHALIESDDAPALETMLHQVFDDRRVNRVNRRKEYFKVQLDEIEQQLEKLGVEALINKVASADEYYQSIKLGKTSEPGEVVPA
ncbi:GIY-YIG nuclease family protein [Oceanospirillum sp.]|uniref:GIY-YIG nuclease family protein n=1 Tax=Oceanospirillum sp. TaxID=2021254 RepID=UPI003A8E8669